ncbi:hypothetical protein [Lysinibacillus capsici]|uniref:hypothetical protein n=1 Tax=Lysinibacillus capsici TaxID=2115968 RepID=UPI0036BCC463
MHNNKHVQLKKQRKNALELLKHWEKALTLKNQLEQSTYFTKEKVKCDESN